MEYDIDTANYADLKTLEDRVRRTLYAHGFNEHTSTPLGDMNSLCRNLVQDAAATDAELAALRARLAAAERERDAKHNALADQTNAHFAERIEHERRLAESEAQRAVLVAALEDLITRADEADRLLPYGHGLRTLPARQALANQPPSDLVALVKAAAAFREVMPIDGPRGREFADTLDTLLQSQPGFRALIDREDGR